MTHNNPAFHAAMKVAMDQIEAYSIKAIAANKLRKEQADAIDTARRTLNPKTYNIYNSGTLFGSLQANMNAYNSFRENKVQ